MSTADPPRTGRARSSGAREILALAEALAAADPTEREEHSAALLAVAAEVAPALESLCTTDPEAALRLAGATSMFWQDAGRVDEGRPVVDLGLASAEPGKADARTSLGRCQAEMLCRGCRQFPHRGRRSRHRGWPGRWRTSRHKWGDGHPPELPHGTFSSTGAVNVLSTISGARVTPADAAPMKVRVWP